MLSGRTLADDERTERVLPILVAEAVCSLRRLRTVHHATVGRGLGQGEQVR